MGTENNYMLEASFSEIADEGISAELIWLSLQRAICDAICIMCSLCPDKRVVHHYKNAKKFRTRKKNFNRMERCIRRGK